MLSPYDLEEVYEHKYQFSLSLFLLIYTLENDQNIYFYILSQVYHLSRFHSYSFLNVIIPLIITHSFIGVNPL